MLKIPIQSRSNPFALSFPQQPWETGTQSRELLLLCSPCFCHKIGIAKTKNRFFRWLLGSANAITPKANLHN